MRYVLSLFIFFSCGLLSASAQEVAPAPSARNKAIYVEFLGNGLLVSANYDMRLEKGRQDGHGFRAGIGGLPVNGTDAFGNTVSASLITLPLGYNYLVGKRRSAFEAGAGITPIYLSGEVTEVDGTYSSGSGLTVAGFLNAGYRFQPLNNGFVFRFNWTPAITNEGFQPAWFGLALGFGFK